MLILPTIVAAMLAAPPPPRHWSFEPVRPVAVPAGARHPIDAFLGTKAGAPSDRRTLIRRATFDLTGLPPTPEEIDAFLKDESLDAYERLIDRLLASPHYGEKWGRTWLDVVRYADTAGETADFPAPHAWRYRNYVIDAFNRDKPYDQFLREQIAGDLIAARRPERHAELVTATGFLAISRRFGYDIEKDHFLTIEDTLDTLGKAVLGLTIACARCHDHKYDPVTNRDYYALYGIFDSTRYPFPGCEKNKTPRDTVPLVAPEEIAQRRAGLQSRRRVVMEKLAAAEPGLRRLADQPLAKLAEGEYPNGGRAELPAQRLGDVRVYKGQMVRLTVAPKADNGADSTLVELVIRERGGAGRAWELTRDLLADVYQSGTGFRHDDAYGNRAVWHLWEDVGTPRLLAEFVRDAEGRPGLYAWRGSEAYSVLFANTTAKEVAFQTVRLPARSVALHPGRKNAVSVAWESPVDGFVSVSGRLQDADSSGGDGIAWTLALGPGLGEVLASTVAPVREMRAIDTEAASLEAGLPQAYAVAEGKPHHVPVQQRGDPESPGAIVPRGMPAFLGGRSVTSPSSGREELSAWLTDAKNPLTARVMVNRLWQGHFGAGLVTTPNDFGTRGTPPTQPQLLDWLAGRFVESGWSVKAMHRLLMTSEAYRRGGFRRRLSGEEVRDALLAVSGELDRAPGGPHPFPDPRTWNFTQHGPFSAVYEHNKRSVYLMTQRIKRHPFLALFDGPDPNASTGQRFTTTVPTQALYFMNDPFVHARATALAQRLAALPDDSARLRRASELLYGRAPTPRESEVAQRFLAAGDWASWLRVMLAANEFVYVD